MATFSLLWLHPLDTIDSPSVNSWCLINKKETFSLRKRPMHDDRIWHLFFVLPGSDQKTTRPFLASNLEEKPAIRKDEILLWKNRMKNKMKKIETKKWNHPWVCGFLKHRNRKQNCKLFESTGASELNLLNLGVNREGGKSLCREILCKPPL